VRDVVGLVLLGGLVCWTARWWYWAGRLVWVLVFRWHDVLAEIDQATAERKAAE
jgi:hypothetical protein